MTWILVLIALLTNGEKILTTSIQPSREACLATHILAQEIAKVSDDVADMAGICIKSELNPNAKGQTL